MDKPGRAWNLLGEGAVRVRLCSSDAKRHSDGWNLERGKFTKVKNHNCKHL